MSRNPRTPRAIEAGRRFDAMLGGCAALTLACVSCVGHIGSADGTGELSGLDGAGPNSSGPEPFACGAGDTPEAVPLRRLTQHEYRNAIVSLLSVELSENGQPVERAVVDLGPIETLLSALPKDGPLGNVKLFDASELRTDESHVLVHFQVATHVANLMADDATVYEKLVGAPCPETATDKLACVRALLTSFGAKVLRRPLSVEEQALYLERYGAGAVTGHGDGIKSVVASLLNAPGFIFHLEDQGTPVAGDARRLALTAHEKAARLSFALTGSAPDGALRAKATSGELAASEAFDREVDRLLMLPVAQQHLGRFFKQWLKIPETGDLTSLNPDFLQGLDAGGLVPKVSAETHAFIRHIVWEQRGGLEDLLLSRSAFVSDPALAQVYGVTAGSTQSPLIQLNETHAGLLTRAAMLLGLSESTSPIARGVRVRRHILCDTLAEPGDIDVSDAELQPIADDTLYSTRQIFEHRTSLGRCQACHININGIGFALEGYDTLGRFRSEERKYSADGARVATVPIDTVSVPNVEDSSAEPVQDAVQLSQRIANGKKAHACLTAQWIEYSVGSQLPDSGISCFRDRVYKALTAEQGGGIAEMFRQTAKEIYLAEKAL